MNCFECAKKVNDFVAAPSICRRCGVGLCLAAGIAAAARHHTAAGVR